jgi:hypothetical protein
LYDYAVKSGALSDPRLKARQRVISITSLLMVKAGGLAEEEA